MCLQIKGPKTESLGRFLKADQEVSNQIAGRICRFMYQNECFDWLVAGQNA